MIWDGRYRIDRTLGEGGMGRVVLARDLANRERRVALKILLPEYRHSTAGFMREYVTQRSFHHPNIPATHDLGFARHPRGEVPYFTLEYCPGVPLILAIRRLRRLSQAWPWMFHTLRALDYLHRSGWLHRDMKPGNVLVEMEDLSEQATHLIDFGVAARIGEPPEDVFIGTPEYCAPELLAGEPYDERSDLYAFGLVLYEVITKRRPWRGSDEQQLLDDRLARPYPPIDHPECPEGVSELIADLLRPEPRDRPTTVAEVLVQLAEAVGRREAIETPLAFGRRLEGIQFPPPAEADELGRSWVSGVAQSGNRFESVPAVLVVEAPEGYGVSRLVGELADRGAVGGARVVRVALDEACTQPLDALQAALQVFTRLRDADGGQGLGRFLRGPAGAAAMLTRLHGPTVLLIEGLQRADATSLRTLLAVYSGSANPLLRILASVDPTEAPVAPEAFEGFKSSKRVASTALRGLTASEAALWLDAALGRGVLDVPRMTDIHAVSRGTPVGLVAATADLFERGAILRTLSGYATAEGAPPVAPSALTPSPELDGHLACLRHPLPAAIIRSYLREHALQIPALMADGVLASDDAGWLRVRDPAWQRNTYGSMAAADKMRNHRRLARAIHEAEAFPGQRSQVAMELMRSDRPVLAVPHLVVAAAQSCTTETAATAALYLDRAERLLRHHADREPTEETWRWWVTLWKARVRIALVRGDLEALDEASRALVDLASEAAHLPTLKFALEIRMSLEYERQAWAKLRQDAEARLSLDGGAPTPDARGLHYWAEALALMAEGDIEEALRQLDTGLGIAPAPPRPDVLLKLARARAELLVQLEWATDAKAAVAVYERHARSAGEEADVARAQLLQATVFRLAGQPEGALNRIRRLGKELPPTPLRGVNALVEIEFASCHLEFGWAATASEHVQQALALAEADDEALTLRRARLVEMRVLLAAGERDEARRRLARQMGQPLPAWERALAFEERLLAVEVAFADAAGEGLRLAMDDAQALGTEALAWLGYGPAARALHLAAQAALRLRLVQRAVDLSEQVLSTNDLKPGAQARLHLYLFTLGKAREQARRIHGSQALGMRALEQLRRVASTIIDEHNRRAWLSQPAHAEILVVSPKSVPK